MGAKMTNEEIQLLRDKYEKEYVRPQDFEHRVDDDSLATIYSIIREFKPTNALQAGCWKGGTTLPILSALIKNGKKFNFVASELLDDLRKETEEHAIRQCGVAPKMVGDITKVLDKIPDNLDFFYHDTDHDLETTVWVFENILPKLKDGAWVIFHDWAVEEIDGKWMGKGENGVGGWPETEYMLELHRKGKLPLEKVYWNYHNPGNWELGVFKYKK